MHRRTPSDGSKRSTHSSTHSSGSHASREKCHIQSCRNNVCKRPVGLDGSGSYEYSPYCGPHTCRRRLQGLRPNMSSHICHDPTQLNADLCEQHSYCDHIGCCNTGRHTNQDLLGDPWFCLEHKCTRKGCIKARLDGYRQCSEHLRCSAKQCTQYPVMGGSCCIDHECSLETCHSPTIEDGNGRCKDHLVCNVRSCDRVVGRDQDFCREHKCRHDDCPHRKKTSSAYCTRHCCSFDKCSRIKNSPDADEAEYCGLHECQDPACINPVPKDLPYCSALHACNMPNCRLERIPGQLEDNEPIDLCLYHYRETARQESASYVEAQRKREIEELKSQRNHLESEWRQQKEKERRHREDEKEAKKLREFEERIVREQQKALDASRREEEKLKRDIERLESEKRQREENERQRLAREEIDKRIMRERQQAIEDERQRIQAADDKKARQEAKARRQAQRLHEELDTDAGLDGERRGAERRQQQTNMGAYPPSPPPDRIPPRNVPRSTPYPYSGRSNGPQVHFNDNDDDNYYTTRSYSPGSVRYSNWKPTVESSYPRTTYDRGIYDEPVSPQSPRGRTSHKTYFDEIFPDPQDHYDNPFGRKSRPY